MEKIKKLFNIKWTLVLYDAILYLASFILMFVINKSIKNMQIIDVFINSCVGFLIVFLCRFFGRIYNQIWRYGGIQCYIRLLCTDMLSMVLYLGFECGLCNLLGFQRFTISKIIAMMSFNTLLALGMSIRKDGEAHKIYVAIVGAGNVGVSLAEELLDNKNTSYTPVCFFDTNKDKAGRDIYGIPVFQAKLNNTFDILKDYGVKEIIFALPPSTENTAELYDYYKKSNCKIKIYDYPSFQTAGKKRQLREFEIEDLLFRKPIEISDEKTLGYYANKAVLITGGGGSIGSELCRQLAKMSPKQIIILDIYENGVYDVQQELKFKYGNKLDLEVEIASITDKDAMSVVFEKYHPDIVINAAAHKHVPLMEHNCVEAIKNNVFGTENVLELCEEYGVDRFMMVSTDKAVNPTNVMGATKRMCEMIAQSYATRGKVKCSCTRFGNVLGSAGSVIPLFKRQIAAGGPVTLTDKRIIRYFMTIPEASQLVLQSGAIAKNGEIFVLDMGQPIKIYDLAKNMIKLSAAQNIEIIETGLRPGEKLYEELLVRTDELDTTENDLIFVEKEEPISYDEVEQKLSVLKNAVNSKNNDLAREALRSVIPTFKSPEEVNKNAEESMEMNIVKTIYFLNLAHSIITV